MDVITSRYDAHRGWNGALRADLDSRSTLVLVFGGSGFSTDDRPFADLRAAFPSSHIVGCSTAGEILGTSVGDASVIVAVARFARARLAAVSAPILPETSGNAGETLGRALGREDLRAVFVLAPGHAVNGSQLTDGLQRVLGNVPISGGLAGDGVRFERTWVLSEGRPHEGIVCAVGLYGDVLLGHGTRGGWDKFGPERRITRSRANVLYELDGGPALDLYMRYLGDLAEGLPSTALLYPLAVRPTRATSDQVVRTVLAHTPADRSLTFAGDMPEGWLAQLMRANFDRLTLAASEAAHDACAIVPGAQLCVAISCVGRRLVLGQRVEDETEAVAEILPRGCPIVGFYSYGEISPLGVHGCRLHNQTMTLTTFGERA